MQKGLLAGWRNVAANFMHLGMIQVSNALVQLLLFPFIIRKTGLEAFGPVVVANSYAALMGLLVNWGTSISGIKDAAAAQGSQQKLSLLFSQTLLVRIVLLTLPLLSLPIVWMVAPNLFIYILLAMPLVLAELINPLYFFNGTEKLLPFNISNLLGKVAAVLLILFFVNGPAGAKWVNFLMALPALLVFAALNIYLFKKQQLHWVPVKRSMITASIKRNLPLAGNNLSVQLQQSFFLFVLSASSNALLLGAYAIIDKVLWGFRLILIAFSNALMPKAVHLAAINPELARRRKRQINGVLAAMFSLVALLLYAKPEWIVMWFAGKDIALASTLARAVALVPLLMALNALNVIEMLVQQRYRDIFKIALLLTAITIVTSLALFNNGSLKTIAWYPVSMEAAALGLYLLFLRRKQKGAGLA